MSDNIIKKPESIQLSEQEKQETQSIVEKIVELIRNKHL